MWSGKRTAPDLSGDGGRLDCAQMDKSFSDVVGSVVVHRRSVCTNNERGAHFLSTSPGNSISPALLSIRFDKDYTLLALQLLPSALTSSAGGATVSVWTNHYPFPKLQALVYDILPWRKVPESDARSVPPPLTASAEKCPRPLTPFCSFTSSLCLAICVALVRMSSFSNCSFSGSSCGSSTNLSQVVLPLSAKCACL